MTPWDGGAWGKDNVDEYRCWECGRFDWRWYLRSWWRRRVANPIVGVLERVGLRKRPKPPFPARVWIEELQEWPEPWEQLTRRLDREKAVAPGDVLAFRRFNELFAEPRLVDDDGLQSERAESLADLLDPIDHDPLDERPLARYQLADEHDGIWGE